MNKFRSDINGLRAWAVMAVLFYHVDPQRFPGGFSGVDVFFVISGYLMTGIVLERLIAGSFSLPRFYFDRFKRLVPVLLALCLVLLSYGWFYLTPNEYGNLGRHAAGSLGFVSNYIYAAESNYFDKSTIRNWLLHTWSLSVEWQFYLLYPLLLLAAWGWRRVSGVRTTIYLLAIASFVTCLYLVHSQPEAAFFGLPSRAWELLLGAIAYLHPLNATARTQRLVGHFGFVLLIVGLLFASDKLAWPGALTLVPTVGAGLILLAFSGGSVLLNNGWAQRLGSASYSIYLWHWPIVVWLYAKHPGPAVWQQMLCLLICVAVGMLSHRYLENIMRQGREPVAAISLPFRQRAGMVAGGTVIGIAGALAVAYSGGMPSRYDGADMPLTTLQTGMTSSEFNVDGFLKIKNPYEFFQIGANWSSGDCHQGGKERLLPEIISRCYRHGASGSIFVFGDSIAAALTPGLNAFTRKENIGLFQFTDGNAPPFFDKSGVVASGRTLRDLNRLRLEAIREVKPSLVLMTWSMFQANGLEKEDAVPALQQAVALIKQVSPTSKVAIIGPMPRWNGNLSDLYIQNYRDTKQELPLYTDLLMDVRMSDWDDYFKVKLANSGAQYISAMDVLCHDRKCLTRVGEAPQDILVFDAYHLTPHASIYFIDQIKSKLFKLL